LESVSWADELVVVDSKSTDKTVELARGFTPNIFVTDWMGYGVAKNYALERATNVWVLWVDADERVPPELAKEIQQIIRDNLSGHNAFEMARRAFFVGKWIKHCGWYPGYVVRLFKKNAAKFNSAKVHEKLNYDGSLGRLTNDLIHYTDDNLFHYVSKFNRYTSLAAEELLQRGRRATLYDLLVRPPYLFLKMFFFRLGFFDGMHGLTLSFLSAAYVFTKYAKAWETNRSAH
jgi:glycosyltransferase involved in cell wall biosynthesis